MMLSTVSGKEGEAGAFAADSDPEWEDIAQAAPSARRNRMLMMRKYT